MQAVVVADGPAVPTDETFVRRISPSLFVLGNHIYIDGGSVVRQMQDRAVIYFMNNTLSLPLDTSWTNDTVEMKVLDPAPGGSTYGTSFWPGESTNKAYRFGGWDQMASDAHYFYRLDADGSGGGTWTKADQPVWLNYSLNSGYSASSKSTGFYYRGESQRYGLSSLMIEYDFESGQWLRWSDINSTDASLAGGAAYALNYGAQGLLLLVGGVHIHLPVNGKVPLEANFNSIRIYDPYSKTWYRQSTSGTIPSSRAYFCLVQAQGPKGTIELVMYGGSNVFPRTEAAQDGVVTYYDIYILSIPSFRWFLVKEFAVPRVGHACELIGQRQMLVVGGVDDATQNRFSRDPFTQGLGVFDLVELKWKSRYEADAGPYKPPKPMQEWYDQASMDSVDWSSAAVKDLFKAGIDKASPFGQSAQSSSLVPSSSSKPSISATTDVGNDSPNTEVIIGAILGSLACVSLIVGLIIWGFRRGYWSFRKNDLADTWQKPELPAVGHQLHELHEDPFWGAELDFGDVLELASAVPMEEAHELSPTAREAYELGQESTAVAHEMGPTASEEVHELAPMPVEEAHELGASPRVEASELDLAPREVCELGPAMTEVYELNRATTEEGYELAPTPRQETANELEDKTTLREPFELE